ncbi:fatty acid desaturase [Sediminimonas sp.]|uniref:fatty acid desaturase n=1 Tax=Sediminimonas sp. TaxID=2823379 RepID=UPI0025F75BC6|nr:fatty acid desaturase [Sediminimonas sp.]
MPTNPTETAQADPAIPARNWIRTLARYREPILWRSIMELAISLAPLVAIWALAWWAMSLSPLLSVLLAAINGGFLVRLFVIQHDCGHGAYFANRHANEWVGRGLGVLTLTPYDVWRRTHSIHHASHGNLDKRGLGDVHTLTVAEYRARPWHRRMLYRLYRNPLVLFGLGPTYLFLVQNRVPLGLMRAGWRYWLSAMTTNAALVAATALIVWLGGWGVLFAVFVPTVLVAASAGVWLFYVQHQFEDTMWDRDHDWQLHEAALHGSSHYVMPGLLRWFTANIGVHHIHHLYSRIPFYRLPEVLRDHHDLANAQQMTIRESLACARRHLWDEETRQLLSFRRSRAMYG